MAKPIKTLTPPTPPDYPKSTFSTINSYRIDKLSQFEFQGYQLEKKPDGSYKETRFGKPDLLDLVARRIFTQMRAESQEVFLNNKKGVIIKSPTNEPVKN
jgi:hypothetical protein